MRRTLVIERLGRRGEGVARTKEGLVFVPFALPGESVVAEVEGERGRLIDVLASSGERVAPSCPHFGTCGGCAVQALAPSAYAAWKRGLVANALRNAGLDLEVAPLVDAHGEGRRRATFHARFEGGRARLGFMQARTHEVVAIDACPLLAPEMAAALPAARAIAQALAERGKLLDLVATATQGGLDLDVRGAGPLVAREISALAAVAEAHDLARISSHGALVAFRGEPKIAVGETFVALPPGAFLQATQEGEVQIARFVEEAIRDAKRVADLFCGVGAFALRLAARRSVVAYDVDAPALAALQKAARTAPSLRAIDAHAHDLFRNPLSAVEVERFGAVVFDPPRAGAEAQARAFAASRVPVIVAVSCNPLTFARDAGVLLRGGYAVRSVTPIDQFRFSPHVEIVASFEKKAKPATRRGLLSR